MVHHAVYCLMAAFASERMLVIDKADEIFGLEKGPFIYYIINFRVGGRDFKKVGTKNCFLMLLKWFIHLANLWLIYLFKPHFKKEKSHVEEI